MLAVEAEREAGYRRQVPVQPESGPGLPGDETPQEPDEEHRGERGAHDPGELAERIPG